jgi:hypothetical protein
VPLALAVLSYNPPMRRRWKWLAAFGAVALFAFLLLLLPPGDGLDWIRKYGGKEVRRSSPILGNRSFDSGHMDSPKTIPVSTQFIFDSIPTGMESEVRRRIVRFDFTTGGTFAGETSDGVFVYFSRGSKQMYVTRESKLNWISRKWSELRKSLGWL